MPAASTIKVVISAALWVAVEEGAIDAARRIRAGAGPVPGGGGLLESLDPDTAPTLADLDLLMLAVSDNAATNVLIDMLGMGRVNGLAARLGLRGTALRRRMMDSGAAARGEENTTCAADLAALFAALAWADGIPVRASRRVLAALAQAQHTDVIPRHLAAPGRVIACKQGMLDGVLHDAALLEDPGQRVALAMMSQPASAPDALARLAVRVHAAVTCS